MPNAPGKKATYVDSVQSSTYLFEACSPSGGQANNGVPPSPHRQAREEFGVDYFLVWHAIAGYWAGLDLDSPDLAKYKPRRAVLNAPPGVLLQLECCVLSR